MVASTVKVVKRKTKFTQISNTALYDPELSARDKGVLSILLSFPDDWIYHQSHILTLMTDEITSFQSGLEALQKNGYMLVFQIRKGGRFDKKVWIIDDEKIASTTVKEALLNYDIELSDDEYTTPEKSNNYF